MKLGLIAVLECYIRCRNVKRRRKRRLTNERKASYRVRPYPETSQCRHRRRSNFKVNSCSCGEDNVDTEVEVELKKHVSCLSPAAGSHAEAVEDAKNVRVFAAAAPVGVKRTVSYPCTSLSRPVPVVTA